MLRAFVLLIVATVLHTSAGAQTSGSTPPQPPGPGINRDSLPYKLNPNLPEFNILLRDSVTIFNTADIPTGRPVVLMLFSPDCKHCKHAMEALTKGMDSISNIRFYLATGLHDMTRVQKFYEEHRLDRFKNIEVVGRDYDFEILAHFGAMHIPTLALYDTNKQFVHLFEGSVTVKELYELTNNGTDHPKRKRRHRR
jgi:thiol-disulfide isomerase/thioredoxin